MKFHLWKTWLNMVYAIYFMTPTCQSRVDASDVAFRTFLV